MSLANFTGPNVFDPPLSPSDLVPSYLDVRTWQGQANCLGKPATVTFYETLTAYCEPGYSSGCTALAVEMYRSKCTATPMNTQFLSGNVTYYREVGLSTANQTMTTYIQADTCLATKYDSDTTFAKYTCSSNPSTPPVKLVCADAACTQCNTTATPAGATCAHGVGTNISEDNSDENAASTVPTNGVGANPVVGGAAWIVATVTALLFV